MFKTLLQMTRPVNIVIAIITLVVGYFLLGVLPGASNGVTVLGISWIAIILQSLGFAFAIGFGNIQNDVLDFESDKKNRPDRPLPSGRISMKAAKTSWIVMLILSVGCGFADNLTSGIFFGVLALLLVAYNMKLKHIPLLKNMTVAYLCMTPLILTLVYPIGIPETDIVGMDISSKLGFLYPAMMFAFLLTTAREIYKDLEDETGDLMAGIMTFPLIAGAPTAHRLAGAILAFTWILLPLPVVQGYYSTLFLILALVALTPSFIYIIVQAKKQNYHKAQSTVKIAMFAGLIALVVSTAV
ncbi:geranylgeranylglycerol-phosphate geranylgeranyltransferase [Fibrobacter sp. UWEL]|uniref:geranylgeranylglycerol-phosphate geranylgeranyltransferase n=1 Tax=Fibrobacter sp. UWEL TaxID=1896209 RepID=UPI00090F4FB2|nr:geranylgeranylglycerol-phosphate geranylgeranyltransferase [Fibrobacter sp. UWEL]SHK67029.1 4-hydroxybenzoate polyprenyltransferase/geranylgeranylglycerol-phosphate geranylgeranyltransferase [Fibrobacter sp. UWEL]